MQRIVTPFTTSLAALTCLAVTGSAWALWGSSSTEPQLTDNAQLNAQLVAQQAVMPATLEKALCSPTELRQAKAAGRASAPSPEVLYGFTCQAKVIGQGQLVQWVTYPEKDLAAGDANFEPLIRASIWKLTFAATRNDSGMLKVTTHVASTDGIDTQTAARAIKTLLAKLGAAPIVNTDAALKAAQAAQQEKAWESERKANAASWSKP